MNIEEEARAVLNQMNMRDTVGVIRDGVWEINERVTAEPGNGGDSAPGRIGGTGGDIVFTVPAGCTIHFRDATILPPHDGQPAGDTPGGKAGRLIFVWADEEIKP